MRLKNYLIVVKDIERSKRFYHDLFGLEPVLDNGGNMILSEGLVLQEEKYWSEFLGREIIPENNSGELYFEEPDINGFIEKLESYYPDVKYVNRLMTHSWGQKVIRFYDPDGNLIEVGTPM
ncbi:MAG: VOC family protein [Ruminococcus sp.]|nr:VOC family protein [Ruminococcus sp.]